MVKHFGLVAGDKNIAPIRAPISTSHKIAILYSANSATEPLPLVFDHSKLIIQYSAIHSQYKIDAGEFQHFKVPCPSGANVQLN